MTASNARAGPRATLALFPVPDRFDGYAEACCEFLLGQLRAASQIAHLEGPAYPRSKSVRRERELLPVTQFDNPSVRFQPQALHRGYP